MKIILLSYYYPPVKVALNRTLEISNYLAKKGEKIIVITGDPGGRVLKDKNLIKKINSKIIVKRIKRDFTEPLSRLLFKVGFLPTQDITWAVKCARIIIKEKPDIVIASASPANTFIAAILAKRKIKFKYIAEYRDYWKEIFRKKIFKHEWLNSLNIKKADKIIVLEDISLKEYPELAKKAILSSHIIKKISRKKSRSNKIRLIYSGYVDDETTLDKLIEAVKELPKTTLLIHAKKMKIKQLKDQASHSKNIIISTPVNQSQAWRELDEQDIGVECRTRYPVLGGKVSTYIAAGMPIFYIGPDGPLSEMITAHELGWIVTNTTSKEELKKVISTITKNKIRKKEENIESYYNEKMEYKKTLKQYYSLIKGIK